MYSTFEQSSGLHCVKCVRAFFINSSPRSMPVTWAPRRASCSVNRPAPQPTSKIRCPFNTFVVLISFDLTVPRATIPSRMRGTLYTTVKLICLKFTYICFYLISFKACSAAMDPFLFHQSAANLSWCLTSRNVSALCCCSFSEPPGAVVFKLFLGTTVHSGWLTLKGILNFRSKFN